MICQNWKIIWSDSYQWSDSWVTKGVFRSTAPRKSQQRRAFERIRVRRSYLACVQSIQAKKAIPPVARWLKDIGISWQEARIFGVKFHNRQPYISILKPDAWYLDSNYCVYNAFHCITFTIFNISRYKSSMLYRLLYTDGKARNIWIQSFYNKSGYGNQELLLNCWIPISQKRRICLPVRVRIRF